MEIITGNKIQNTAQIAIVISRFNENVTQALLHGALTRLTEFELQDNVTVIWVPGAIEIPLLAQRCAQSEQYAAIICLGAVIRGETSHYDYVCQQVSYGCQTVSLKYDVPVIFGVLTTDTEEQALQRAGGEHGNKGVDAVNAALEMISVLKQINTATV